jgi:membrane fusion protein, multidrug efflux system
MRRILLIVAPVLALAVIAYGGWYWWTEWRFWQTTDDAYIEADTVVIAPQVEGTLNGIKVEDNQRVKADQILFTIDDTDYQTRVSQARAVVATDESTLGTYDSRIALQGSMIDQAIANETVAETEVTRANLDLKRYTALISSSVASKQQFDTASADAQKATAELIRAKAAIAAARNQFAVFQSQRAEENARLDQARGALALALSQLDDTIIRAPVDGVAGNRAGQMGQYVKPGQQLLSLVPLPHVYVTANFKETQLTRMRPGQTATVEVDAYPDQAITGKVESFAPASGAQFSILPPDNATGNFTKIVQRVPVRIELPADGPLASLLRPGLSVTVSVDTRTNAAETADHGIVGTAQAAPAGAK